MTEHRDSTHPYADRYAPTSSQDTDAGCPGCSVCLPELDDEANMPTPQAFTLVGYGQVIDRDLKRPDELVVDAYGVVLPDGRVVTHTDDPHSSGDRELRVWARVEDAASHWGSLILWPAPVQQPCP